MLSFAHLVFLEVIILPIEKPPSCEAVSYSDTEVKQNDASLDCLLRKCHRRRLHQIFTSTH